MAEIIKTIVYGIVEGITEWLPISSTGHLILLEELLPLNQSPEFLEMFRVVIQLGAILAVVVQYWRTFWAVGMGLLRWRPESVAFLRNILLGFYTLHQIARPSFISIDPTLNGIKLSLIHI